MNDTGFTHDDIVGHVGPADGGVCHIANHNPGLLCEGDLNRGKGKSDFLVNADNGASRYGDRVLAVFLQQGDGIDQKVLTVTGHRDGNITRDTGQSHAADIPQDKRPLHNSR